MTYDMDQAQRRDIETALGRISLEVDSENTSDNPYLHIPPAFVGNNWFQQGEKIVKLNITEDDSLSFVVSALTNLRQKNVTNVIVSFDYEVDNVNVNYPLLINVSFASSDLTSYKSCETILTTQGHIEVDCSLFDFSSDIVNNAITEQGFTIGLNFNGNLSNATVKISNVVFGFKYTNLLQAEIDAVKNRLGDLNPNIEIVTSWNETLSNDKVPSEKLTKESIDVKADSVHSHIVTDVDGLQSSLDSKQAKLVSGTNIKTINNTSLLGSGNITIQGGSSVDIVTSWSSTLSDSKVPSEKLTKNSLDGKANSSHTHTKSQITDFPTIPSKISDLTNDSDFIETSSTSGLIKNDGTVDTTQYQVNLISGTNIKTINHQDILGSGNISVSNVTYYSLSSSDYNPSIDSTVTITCTVTNASGVPVIGKNVELFNNGVSAGTVSTDLNGTASWNVTLSDWDNHHFNVETAILDLMANGWKTVTTVTYGTMHINGRNKLCLFKYYRSSYNFTSTGLITLHTGACGDYKPISEVYCSTINPTISCLVTAGGDIKVQSTTTGTKNIGVTAMWHY